MTNVLSIRDSSPNRSAQFQPLKYLATTGVLAGVYYFAAKLGLQLALFHPSASPVWPPTGIAFAAILVLGYRVWPAIFIGAFLANVTTEGTVATSIGIAVGNTTEGLIGSYLVIRFANGLHAFDRPQSIFRFVLLAAIFSTTVSATIGVISLSLGGFADWGNFGLVWLTWWLGDAAGDIIIAPVLVLWYVHRLPRWNRKKFPEAIALLLSLAIGGWVVFGLYEPPWPYRFLLFPLLLWAAFRFEKPEAASIVLLFSAISLWTTVQHQNILTRSDAHELLLLVQTYLGALGVITLVVAAEVSERKRVERDLRTVQDELAGKVEITGQALIEAQQISRVGSWEWDIRRNVVTWSDEMFRRYGLEPQSIALSYEDFLKRVPPDDRPMIDETVQGSYREHTPFEFDHRVVWPDGSIHWLHARGDVIVDERGNPIRMVGSGQDIDERRRAQEALSELSGRLLQLQDEERRRIALELHDNTSPLLTSLIGKLYTLQRQGTKLDETTSRALGEILTLAEHTSSVISNVTSLLHPTVLEQSGLLPSLRWYLDDFSKRSSIRVAAEFPESLKRLSKDAEIALFRIVQECMTNIERHSGSRTALIRITQQREIVTINVKDTGRGFLPGILDPSGSTVMSSGVGIRGMMERMKQLGGRLDIESRSVGTTVRATLPLGKAGRTERR